MRVVQTDRYTLYCGDCLDYMRTLPAGSVDAIVTDPPYYKVKDEAWDRKWETPAMFLAWLDTILAEVERVLKSNGSLYLFAGPRMAARVEVLIAQRFEVLNHITWAKTDKPWNITQHRGQRAEKESLRSYFPESERIIFAEHYGADSIAKGEAGYEAKCDELRGFVFEPLRSYLASERDRAGLTTSDVAEAWRVYTGNTNRTGMAGHWFERVQWSLPTEQNYNWLRQTFAQLNGGGDYLRREYEDLRREYEDLRRPFYMTADAPFTDVWTFPTVQAYPGKHPTEKPVPVMRHIIEASSRPGSTVLDPFMGSGTTGVACMQTGRRFIGVEIDPGYFEIAKRRIEDAAAQLPLIPHEQEPQPRQEGLL